MRTQVDMTSINKILCLHLTWEDEHHDVVQRLAEAGAAHGQGGVEVIEEEVEDRDQQPGGASHDVPDGEQGLARAVLQVQQAWGEGRVK